MTFRPLPVRCRRYAPRPLGHPRRALAAVLLGSLDSRRETRRAGVAAQSKAISVWHGERFVTAVWLADKQIRALMHDSPTRVGSRTRRPAPTRAQALAKCVARYPAGRPGPWSQ